MPSVPYWLAQVNNPLAPWDMDALSLSFRSLYESLAQDGLTAVDLSKVARDSLNIPHAVGLLRATAGLKADLSGWYELKEDVRVALSQNGYCADEILRGL